MSIPVERRELNDGWVLTCRGESGGDLTLSDVIIKRENLCCQVLGGETMFFPMFGKNHDDTESLASGMSQSGANSVHDPEIIESSILDHIRELLELAHREGYWEAGVGGVEKVSHWHVIFVALSNVFLAHLSRLSSCFATAAIRSLRRLFIRRYASDGCHQLLH